ncbi:hypothetical protein ANTRET_LOCUS5737 [Anthophora retusa]
MRRKYAHLIFRTGDVQVLTSNLMIKCYFLCLTPLPMISFADYTFKHYYYLLLFITLLLFTVLISFRTRKANEQSCKMHINVVVSDVVCAARNSAADFRVATLATGSTL